MTCGHWTVGDHQACGQVAVALVVCSDDSETWRGRLCEEHLMAYQADAELDLTIVRDWR
jgi:hypothetical protein